MQNKCRVTVLDCNDIKNYPSKILLGDCPFYKNGDEYFFSDYGEDSNFWSEGKSSHCSNAWDCISEYVYSLMNNNTKDNNIYNNDEYIINCNDEKNAVSFKVERLYYKVIKLINIGIKENENVIKSIIYSIPGVTNVIMKTYNGYIEVYMNKDKEVTDQILIDFIEENLDCEVSSIE